MATTVRRPKQVAPPVPDDTLGGIPLQDVYRPADVSAENGHNPETEPAVYPYTRGIHQTMYRGRVWTMRQFAGFGSAKQTNGRYHQLLDAGQTGLSVAFDMPTLMGRDSDDPRSRGEVGHCGVAVDSVEDMKALFDGIDLGVVTTSMTINPSASITLAQYLVVAEESRVSWRNLGGTLQNDILKEYIAQKEFCFPIRHAMRLVTDSIVFSTEQLPRFHPVSISGYHIREAGSTAAQELAFTLADGFAYIEETIKAGVDVDTFAPRLSFFFDAHIDFFEEIAKFRAARRIYARRMRDKYGARDERSLKLKFHTQTAGVSLTAQQPENNIVRTAVEALAAVLGGTQSLHTNALDETLALPTAKSAQIALRTQQVLAYETGVPSVVDPLGGSWFIEKLTDEMEAQAEAYLQEIDSRGGMVPAVEQGYPQREIAEAAFRFQRQLESGERVIVGVNSFEQDVDPTPPNLLRIEKQVEVDQVAALRHLRESRDNISVANRLGALKEVAAGTENTMPAIVDCVRARCTEGEIIAALEDVFGTYREVPTF
jgi:methylmalonyl-CoA mutase N-terminal domain/subunit